MVEYSEAEDTMLSLVVEEMLDTPWTDDVVLTDAGKGEVVVCVDGAVQHRFPIADQDQALATAIELMDVNSDRW